jgi:hypothetical protein
MTNLVLLTLLHFDVENTQTCLGTARRPALRAGGEGRSAEEREPMPPPHTEVAVESTLGEATLVEGMCSSQLVVIMQNSRSR